MEREAGIAPPLEAIREEPRRPRITSGGVLRLLVFVALAAFLLYYVGPRDIAADGAQGRSRRRPDRGALGRRQPPLRPGLRPLDPLQHHRRCRRSASSATSSPSRTARSRRSSTTRCGPSAQGLFDDVTGWVTRPFDVNSLLWGLIGGAALGLVMFLLSAPRQQLARLPLAVLGFTGFGLLTAFALDDSVWPALDWGKLLICAGGGAVVFGLIGLWRYGRAAAPLSVITGIAVGWLVGAWGGADIGGGNFGEVVVATVVPAAIFGVRFGLAAAARRPEATAHRSALPRLDLRHAGAGVHRHRVAGPADPHDLPLVPQPQRHQVRRVGQLQRRSSPTRTR